MAERQKSEHKFAYLPFSCYNERSEKTSGCAADICFSQAINERIACVSRQ